MGCVAQKQKKQSTSSPKSSKINVQDSQILKLENKNYNLRNSQSTINGQCFGQKSNQMRNQNNFQQENICIVYETEKNIENKTNFKETPHSPEIGNKLKNVVSSTEVQRYINKRQSMTCSPHRVMRITQEQKRKTSLMNSPQS